MLRSMSYGMLAEWQAYDAMEPIDSRWRADLDAGILASVLANIWGKRSGAEPYKPRDFMPRFDDASRKPKTPAEIYHEFRTWALMSGAKKVVQ